MRILYIPPGAVITIFESVVTIIFPFNTDAEQFAQGLQYIDEHAKEGIDLHIKEKKERPQ